MSEKNLFELATRERWRFPTSNGEVTTEQLWNLSLTGAFSVDAVALALNEEINKTATKSFVTKATATNTEAALKLELVKHIISVRLAEKADKVKKAEIASQRKLLREAIAAKEAEALLEGSAEDLKKRLAEITD